MRGMPDELHRAVRIFAADEGISINAAIIELLQRQLASQLKASGKRS